LAATVQPAHFLFTTAQIFYYTSSTVVLEKIRFQAFVLVALAGNFKFSFKSNEFKFFALELLQVSLTLNSVGK
jgi:hypothetical protein